MTDGPAEASVWPRPRLHFAPRTGWMNDPNGLIVLDDQYHLYFQHNPGAPHPSTLPPFPTSHSLQQKGLLQVNETYLP